MSNLIQFDATKSYLVSLHISIWSGRAKLTRDELDSNTADKLPPEQLAMLGQKKLINPELLKPLTAIKTKALTFMDMTGVKMLNGWLCHESRMSDIGKVLDELADQFRDCEDNFINNYADAAAAWAAQFPEWERMILNALPPRAKLERKFNFAFTAYKLEPYGSGFGADQSAKTLQNISSAAYEQLREDLLRVLETSFADTRETFRASALRPLRAISDKARNYAFTDPQMGVFAQFMDKLVAEYESDVKDSNRMSQLRLILKALTQPDNFGELCHEQISADLDPVALLSGVCQAQPAPMPEPEPEPEPEPASTPEPEPQSATQPEPAPQPEPEPEQVPDGYADILASLGL